MSVGQGERRKEERQSWLQSSGGRMISSCMELWMVVNPMQRGGGWGTLER
jgi:hypothetical protein